MFIPDREAMAHQSIDMTKVYLSKPVTSVMITYGNIIKGLLSRAKMTKRQLYHPGPPSIGDSSQNLGNANPCPARGTGSFQLVLMPRVNAQL